MFTSHFCFSTNSTIHNHVKRKEILKKQGRKEKKHIFCQGAFSQGKPWILIEEKEARIDKELLWVQNLTTY